MAYGQKTKKPSKTKQLQTLKKQLKEVSYFQPQKRRALEKKIQKLNQPKIIKMDDGLTPGQKAKITRELKKQSLPVTSPYYKRKKQIITKKVRHGTLEKTYKKKDYSPHKTGKYRPNILDIENGFTPGTIMYRYTVRVIFKSPGVPGEDGSIYYMEIQGNDEYLTLKYSRKLSIQEIRDIVKKMFAQDESFKYRGKPAYLTVSKIIILKSERLKMV